MAKYRAEIREYGGVPTVFVNNYPVHGLMPADGTIKPLLSANTGMYILNVSWQIVDDDGVITGPSEKAIDEVLADDPDGLICLGTHPMAPISWLKDNPDQLQMFAPGEPAGEETGVYPIHWAYMLGLSEWKQASFASRQWREQVVAVYEEYSRRMHEKYDGRVIMHFFGAGAYEEWNPSGVPDESGRWWTIDFSPAMVEYFRDWLRKRYDNDTSELQRKWGNGDATFDTAEVPGREERMRSDWFTFRHPLKRQVSDFHHAYADAIADNIIAFSKAIKKGTSGECLVGTHSGPFLDNGLNAYLYVQVAANTMRRVIRESDVDFYTCPISFMNRGPGGGTSPMLPTGSLRLHGKLYLHDEDSRVEPNKNPHMDDNVIYSTSGVPKSEMESKAIMKRNVGRDILNGWNVWWHDFFGEQYVIPFLQETATRLTEIARVALHLKRGSISDMAVIADEQSPFQQQNANRLLYPLLYGQRVEVFSHAGISWSIFEAADLCEKDFEISKLMLMLNLFELTPARIDEIRGKLAGSGAIVVWFVAPGIQAPDGFDFEAIRRLTGFEVSALDAEGNPRVSLTNYDHPITQGLGSFKRPHSIGTGIFGNDERDGIFGPIFYIDDEESTTLGMLNSLYRPGLAVKEMDGWTSVYSVAPRLSRPLLRNLAKVAGIHSYVDSEDMICVSPELMVIHGVGEGERTIRLPKAVDVVDLWTDETLGRQITELAIRMAACDTKILFHGDLERLKNARRLAKRQDTVV